MNELQKRFEEEESKELAIIKDVYGSSPEGRLSAINAKKCLYTVWLESQLTWRSAEESPVVEDTYFVILYDLETRREYPTTAWYEAESGWSFYLPEDHCRVLKWMPIPIQGDE